MHTRVRALEISRVSTSARAKGIIISRRRIGGGGRYRATDSV